MKPGRPRGSTANAPTTPGNQDRIIKGFIYKLMRKTAKKIEVAIEDLANKDLSIEESEKVSRRVSNLSTALANIRRATPEKSLDIPVRKTRLAAERAATELQNPDEVESGTIADPATP